MSEEINKVLQSVAARSSKILGEFAQKQAQGLSATVRDEMGIAKAFMDLYARMAMDPNLLASVSVNLWVDYVRLWQSTWMKMMGVEGPAVAEPLKGDGRFKDAEWSSNFLFDYLKQSYLITARHIQGAVAQVEGLPEESEKKVAFFTRQYVDALSPSNFVLTNPQVLRETLQTGGENLVRGLNNEPAYQIIKRYSGERMGAFDAACRAKAIEVAARIGIQTYLTRNFLPSAALDPVVGLNSTIETATVVEATEGEAIGDPARFAKVINEYRRAGLRLAIDDFGAGYSGLNLLAEFQPDIVKLDMVLVRGIQSHGPRQAIVRAIAQVCVDLGIDLVAEGVETVDEYSWFCDLGVNLYQGYLFAKPMFEAMPPFQIPELR